MLAEGERALCFTQFAEFGRPARAVPAGPARHARCCSCTAASAGGGARTMVAAVPGGETDGPADLAALAEGGRHRPEPDARHHVFHFDRWWNPAVEDQATDRAFRIGQRRNVQVHKFVCAGTVEERIDALIAVQAGALPSWSSATARAGSPSCPRPHCASCSPSAPTPCRTTTRGRTTRGRTMRAAGRRGAGRAGQDERGEPRGSPDEPAQLGRRGRHQGGRGAVLARRSPAPAPPVRGRHPDQLHPGSRRADLVVGPLPRGAGGRGGRRATRPRPHLRAQGADRVAAGRCRCRHRAGAGQRRAPVPGADRGPDAGQGAVERRARRAGRGRVPHRGDAGGRAAPGGRGRRRGAGRGAVSGRARRPRHGLHLPRRHGAVQAPRGGVLPARRAVRRGPVRGARAARPRPRDRARRAARPPHPNTRACSAADWIPPRSTTGRVAGAAGRSPDAARRAARSRACAPAGRARPRRRDAPPALPGSRDACAPGPSERRSSRARRVPGVRLGHASPE